MDTAEFEQLVQGAVETPGLDFKESCPWDVSSLAKDILAMSNVEDGGHLVIGIKERPFHRVGVNSTDKATYDEETMHDQMTAFADPHVRFRVMFPRDADGKEYVVIRVFEFEEIPVICRKQSAHTKKGVLYYRNRNRRIESAPISNSHDLRDVLDRAAIKLMRRLELLGLTVEKTVAQSFKDKLTAELGGL